MLVSVYQAVLPANLLLPNLYRCVKTKSSWGDILELDSATLKDLEWWLEAFNYWNGRAYKSECSPVIEIATDGSMEGWGCKVVTLDGLEAQGFWDIDMSMKSPNFREMSAVYLSLMSLLPNIKKTRRFKYCHTISQQLHTYAFKGAQWGVDKHCVQNLDTSNKKQCTNHCTLLSREVKYTGRRSFEATEPTRVGTEPKSVPLLRYSLGTSYYRSFRNDQHNQMQTLQQSVSRPRLLWGGRPSPVRLGSRNELCQRPAEASRQCVEYNIAPRGRSYDYCSSVESEKLVPTTKKCYPLPVQSDYHTLGRYVFKGAFDPRWR